MNIFLRLPMKTKILLLVAICSMQNAFAAETDLLREGCAALKPALKKTQCFAALDRLTAAPSAPQPEPEPTQLKLNGRAFNCEAFEFSEIDSWKKNELESASCSFQLAIDVDEQTTKKLMAQQNDARVNVYLAQKNVNTLEKCSTNRSKIDALLDRKYPGTKLDCARMKRKDAPTTLQAPAAK